MAVCNDGVIVNCMGSFIQTSKGETYILMGNMLTGPNGFRSMNVKNETEAEAIIIGLYGGKKF